MVQDAVQPVASLRDRRRDSGGESTNRSCCRATRFSATIVENLHGELTRATGLRVEIENDANAAAYGEYKVGASRGAAISFT